MIFFILQVRGELEDLTPSMEMQLKAVVDSIVKPSNIPGTRHIEEVLVKLGALVRAQKNSLNPGMLTNDMQVSI